MGERKKLLLAGSELDVTEVNVIRKIREEFNEYELEDGSIIRVANPSIVVYRMEGTRDLEGHPTYIVKNGVSVIVVRGPKEQEPHH
jgi:hypothetical protein